MYYSALFKDIIIASLLALFREYISYQYKFEGCDKCNMLSSTVSYVMIENDHMI